MQRREFASRRLIAMPIAGTLAWSLVAMGSPFLGPRAASWLLFVATGMIVYVGLAVSRFTGEHLTDRNRPGNVFDSLFFHGVGQALLVYAIAIPFYLADVTSLPLTVGILTGLMWVPVSWIIGHWVGLFHAVARTLLVLGAWYLFPDQRFVAVPVAIVAVYGVTIAVLERRWRALGATSAAAPA